MNRTLCVLAIALAINGQAAASETVQNYSIVRTADGYVRTDTRTGQTSVCTESDGQLVCRMAADDRKAFEQAYDGDLAALQHRIDSLEQRLAALESGASLKAPAGKPPESEAEFQTSLNRMEQFFRRFMGIVKEFQQFGGETTPPPDRT
jgi:hypothetical protein